MTTIVVDGSFAFSHYPGLRSIAYASRFGIALSDLAAIALLPAILSRLPRSLDQAPNGKRSDKTHPQLARR